MYIKYINIFSVQPFTRYVTRTTLSHLINAIRFKMARTTRKKGRGRPPEQHSSLESEGMHSKKHAHEDSSDITTVSKKQYDDLLILYQELRATKDVLPTQDEMISETNSVDSKMHSEDVDVDFTLPDKESSLLDVNVPPVKDVVKPDVVLENTLKEKITDSDVKTSANASTE